MPVLPIKAWQPPQQDFTLLRYPAGSAEALTFAMDIQFVSLPTLAKLRDHVLQRLCAHDRLDPNQTPLYQAVIRRSGKPCGLFFQVQGPRMLKTHAVWAGQENRI
jgi:hypothetical protein